MHLPPWFWFGLVTLLSWGIVGLLQKLSTNYLSADWALVWLAAGFILLEPWLYPGKALFRYSGHAVGWALLAGVFNALGAWALLDAMKFGERLPSWRHSRRFIRLSWFSLPRLFSTSPSRFARAWASRAH